MFWEDFESKDDRFNTVECLNNLHISGLSTRIYIAFYLKKKAGMWLCSCFRHRWENWKMKIIYIAYFEKPAIPEIEKETKPKWTSCFYHFLILATHMPRFVRNNFSYTSEFLLPTLAGHLTENCHVMRIVTHFTVFKQKFWGSFLVGIADTPLDIQLRTLSQRFYSFI